MTNDIFPSWNFPHFQLTPWGQVTSQYSLPKGEMQMEVTFSRGKEEQDADKMGQKYGEKGNSSDEEE